MEQKQKLSGFSASMTVEASYVMAMVILALSVLVKSAYGQCRKTTEVMRLHQVVEELRCQEDKQSHTLPRGQVFRNDGQVEGYLSTGKWKKEISSKVHEPEELLRKLAIFE